MSREWHNLAIRTPAAPGAGLQLRDQRSVFQGSPGSWRTPLQQLISVCCVALGSGWSAQVLHELLLPLWLQSTQSTPRC